MSRYALRFISGKYQGGEFPLRMEREIIIGRSSDLDMVLVEDMVSRKHAKISTASGQIVIQDLGSTNGSFVNGEKVKKVRLKEGDRILIGTSIMKLVRTDEADGVEPPSEADARAHLERNAANRPSAPTQGKTMSGAIEEIPLPDLLQLLSTSRKSGVLSIQSDRGFGRIYLRKGKIYFASIDDGYQVPPRKAVYRLLTWASGTFELEPPDERQVMEEIDDSTEGLLMEGMRLLDEIKRLESELPSSALLAVSAPLVGRLRDLSPDSLDIFQLVLDHGSLQGVLDHYPGTDLDAYKQLIELLGQGFITQT
ncbi:MAG: DUF4388 domain-containing protein [Pseudomonadota bacterium]